MEDVPAAPLLGQGLPASRAPSVTSFSSLYAWMVATGASCLIRPSSSSCGRLEADAVLDDLLRMDSNPDNARLGSSGHFCFCRAIPFHNLCMGSRATEQVCLRELC